MGEDTIFPFEFFVWGTPRSLGASSDSRERWKETIVHSARRKIAETTDLSWLDERPLSVAIYYFSAAPMEGDIDNIVKPILDALIGVAYPNDRVVERVIAQKIEPDVGWSFDHASEILLSALDTDVPVVYIRIDDDRAWRRN